jgi:hypothetical protein
LGTKYKICGAWEELQNMKTGGTARYYTSANAMILEHRPKPSYYKQLNWWLMIFTTQI